MGYSKFKEQQLRSVVHAMSGRNAFVSFPTGYGESLCYAVLPLAVPILHTLGHDPRSSCAYVSFWTVFYVHKRMHNDVSSCFDPYLKDLYSGNHHTCSYNFFVLLFCSLEYISITMSSNGNLTRQV